MDWTMLEIQHDKIMLEDKVLQFNKIIIEAAEYDGKVVVVFETDEDDGYDNSLLESNIQSLNDMLGE